MTAGLRSFTVATRGPGCHEITQDVAGWLTQMSAGDGVLTLFVRHTSCSLLVQENADPAVQRDLLAWLARVAPAADAPGMDWVTHRSEGADDMPAHLRAAMLPVSLSIPVVDGAMTLGQWQGIYLVEHRDAPQRRSIAAAYQPL